MHGTARHCTALCAALEWNGMEWNGTEWNGMAHAEIDRSIDRSLNRRVATRRTNNEWNPGVGDARDLLRRRRRRPRQGAWLRHGRPMRFKGDEFANIFSHFKPLDWDGPKVIKYCIV